MEKKNGGLERLVDGAGWGLFLVLIGTLILADNQGWLNGNGWFYFFIGLGSIFAIGSLVRIAIGQDNRWQAVGGLVVGLALIYIGIAFLNGFGNWWPLAFISIGIGCLVKAVWGNKHETYMR
jgi:peptidoglycan/LPS O-acetylase OafA/YrhL